MNHPHACGFAAALPPKGALAHSERSIGSEHNA
jgi:hypothetical protein